MKIYLNSLLFWITLTATAYPQEQLAYDSARENEISHGDTTMQSMEGMDMEVPSGQVVHDQADKRNSKITAPLEDFPTLHPMIVHFPIILLLVAAAIQFLNLYFNKKEYEWIVTVLVFVGALTAWLAGENFHPHTGGLSEHAKLVLARHEFWADWTVYLGIAGFIVQAINQFVLTQKKLAAVAVALLLAGAAFSVSMAGHHGAQLAYIEGIGPQGKFLMDEKSEMKH